MKNRYQQFINNCIKYIHKMKKENIPIKIQQILLKEYALIYMIENNFEVRITKEQLDDLLLNNYN